ncbi:energy-coupling factor transport system substrate-specific component [Pilibacter termitis]|uniref:UPF0397 protein SAMN02745116_00271 n=1 Tax=Pilibacter termitis TaxID=263852 RepID=A0A1T4KIB4_9ENTE|nr:ECF-type riboflavin transporter substrate-binding protein [Pilibacter termitis]SJZ42126.1 energy-coupling factor transport system substrate-specific component [Pilibacter termitis]
MKKDISVKTVVATAIGVALFVVVGRFGSIPTGIPNTEFSLAYPILGLIGVLFGPIAGGLTGLIGHALKDAVFYGSVWWSWVISSAILGILFGLIGKKLKVEQGKFSLKDIVLFNIFQVISNLIVWAVVAPVGDVLIYSEPANKVYTQGLVASLVNSVGIGIACTIIFAVYAKTRVQKGSLSKED